MTSVESPAVFMSDNRLDALIVLVLDCWNGLDMAVASSRV
jgi:hypothetical protein